MKPAGYIMLWPGPRYCPRCTVVVHFRGDYTYGGCSKNPIYLVKRKNKTTNDWFWGCPNFPECKYSENRAKTARERDIDIWAWANAQCGPHF